MQYERRVYIMAVMETRNGYGKEFINKSLQDKVVSMKEAQAAVMTKEKAKEYWEKLVTKVEGTKVNSEQRKILKIGVAYFKSVRKTQDTGSMFSIRNYSIKFLPPKVEDELDALAWIFKVGNNNSKLDDFFPNLANKQLPPVKRVNVYSEDPDDNQSDVYMVANKQFREFKGKGSMVDPLVVLRYCFYCDEYGDELQKVKIKVKSHPLNGVKEWIYTIYRIETCNYIIHMNITANSKKEYSEIEVERRSING